MSELPKDTRAIRQRLLAGLLGFLLGLVALLVGVVCVVVMFAREQGWGSAIHVGLHLALWEFVGSMTIGWMAILVIDRIHARLGWLRCPQCGGRLGPGIVACPCDPEYAAYLAHLKLMQRRHRRHLIVRCRKQLRSVVFAWLALIPVTYLMQKTLVFGRQFSSLDLAAGHVLLCGLVAILGVLLTEMMKRFNFGQRLRLRAMTSFSLLAIWPCAGALVMVCTKLFS